jgi:RNA-dependent RNA polymerase
VDDLGILEANEVFCQINPISYSSKKSKFFDDDRYFEGNKSKRQILNGHILVSRNPCTHPGDVRLLNAVDRPEFHYLTNVIVFPSKGERPLCNMMSGGDLDGDVYFVCWD